jgi:putative addiction module CopG family antidote
MEFTASSTMPSDRGKLEKKEMPYMNTHLPADLEQFVEAKVRSGRFTSPDEAIAAGVRLLRKQEEAEEARVLEGIRQSVEDMRAGRTQPLAEAFADIRRDLNLPHGS